MNIFDAIAENKIQQAMERGEFDRLPHHGIPIDITEDFTLSLEVRFVLHRLKASTTAADVPSPLVSRWRAQRYRRQIRGPAQVIL